MAGLSDYAEGKLVGWLNGTAPGTAPAARYVGLFNGDPLDTGVGGSEVTTTIRAAGRVAATFSQSTGVLTSSADVDFGNAAGAVASMTHFAVFDAASSGNMLWAGPLTGQPIAVAAGVQVKFPAGSLTYTLD